MRIQHLFLFALLSPAIALAAEPMTPEATVRAYFTAISERDRAAAIRLTARFPKFNEEMIAAQIEPLLAHRDLRIPQIRESKILGQCAVVILFTSPRDPDPAYLVQQEGIWRVIPKLTQFDRPYFEFSESDETRFRTLESWYRQHVGKPPKDDGPFTYATIRNPELLKKHLDAGFDPNARSTDDSKETLLCRAIRYQAAESAKLLLERGARVDERSEHFKKTPLFLAAHYGSAEIAEMLLAKGADVNALDDVGNNALREAIGGKRLKLVELLLKAGANPNQVNQDGASMRDLAAKYGTPEIKAAFAVMSR